MKSSIKKDSTQLQINFSQKENINTPINLFPKSSGKVIHLDNRASIYQRILNRKMK